MVVQVLGTFAGIGPFCESQETPGAHFFLGDTCRVTWTVRHRLGAGGSLFSNC